MISRVFGCGAVVICFLISSCVLKPTDRSGKDLFDSWNKHENLDQLRRKEADRVKSYLNLSAHPCDDFYEFACGNFIDTVEDFKNVSVTAFSDIMKRISLLTGAMLFNESYSRKPELPGERKAKDFYKSCVESNVEKNVASARKHLKELGDFPLLNSNWSASGHHFDWIVPSAQAQLLGVNSIISVEIGRSPNEDVNVIIVGPEEPSDVNYEDTQSGNKLIYDAFISRRESVFQSIIEDEKAVKKAAEELYLFEMERVKVFGKDYHQFEQDYKEFDYGYFREQFPENDWDKFFEILFGRQLMDSSRIIVRYSQFLRPTIDLLARTDPEVIATFILHDILDKTFVSYLSDEPDEETCTEDVESNFHYILTAMFVRDYYNKESRKHVEEIFKYLNDSARNIIRSAEWLDRESRAEAERKLNGMKLLNGYIDEIVQPSWLQEYFKDLQITPDDFIKNLISVRQHATRSKVIPLGQTKDILPKYYLNFYKFNAFYYYGVNVLAVPLGFQNLPVYHPHMPKSYNFGSLGSFLGHEITHAFDSSGRKYDTEGNVRNWWSNRSIEAFMDASQCFVDAYNKYSISDDEDTYIDGMVTLPENIADNGGVKESYYAYKRWLADHRRQALDGSEMLPGLEFTNLQLFFLSYAQFWCGYLDPSDYASAIRYDHSPGKFRVLGVLSNFEEFSKEFNCPIGSPMNPEHKCIVW